jgi:RNA polymerase sporulation-specific sigma factor
MKELATKAHFARETLTVRLNRQPTLNELATEVGAGTEELIVAMESGLEVESLYTTIHQGDGGPIYLMDKIGRNKDDGDTVVNRIALNQMIGRLKPRERQVILLRYFQDKTQMEVAKAIGVSQVQVSRIEKKVLKMLKDELTAF